MMPSKPELGFQEIDFRAGLNAGVTALIYMLLFHMIPGIDHYLNICVMTIAAIFITETDWETVWSAGLSRCVVMGIGAAFGVVIVFLDHMFQNDILVCILFGAATVCMLVTEKLTGRMYVQCKLGSVAMALTVFTFREAFYAQVGKTCYGYAIMFFLSTVGTVLICLVMTFIWDAVCDTFKKHKNKPESTDEVRQ